MNANPPIRPGTEDIDSTRQKGSAPMFSVSPVPKGRTMARTGTKSVEPIGIGQESWPSPIGDRTVRFR